MPVVFHIGNVSTVAYGDEKAVASLRGALSFRARVGRTGSAILSMAETLPDKSAARFATGMLRFVIDHWAKPLGVDYALHDRRQVPWIDQDKCVSPDWLRDYQQEALAVAQKMPRGIFSHPTGTGKGEIVVALYAIRPVSTIMIVPNDPLLQQIVDRFKARLNVTPTVYGGGFHQISDLVVATYQALNKAQKFPWDRYQQVIFDEVHGAASPTCQALMNKFVNAYYRYGLSATAMLRADQKHYYIIGAFGPVLHKIAFKEAATDLKAIATPKVVYLPYQHEPTDPSLAVWHDAYMAAIGNNVPRNNAAISVIQSAPKPIMVFTKSLAHAGSIYETLRARNPAGFRIALATGEAGKKENAATLDALRQGNVDVLVCTDVFQQGVDVPAVASMMNLAGGKAAIPVIQKVGRAARRYANGKEIKTEFPVYDFADMGCGCNGAEHRDCAMLIAHFLDRKTHYGKLR